MADLIAPHGGLSEPVCCTVGAGEFDAFKAAAAALTKVPGLGRRPVDRLPLRRRRTEPAYRVR